MSKILNVCLPPRGGESVPKYWVELPRKMGGTHIRSLKRDIRRSMCRILADDEKLFREGVVGIIRKGDRYAPKKEWTALMEFHSKVYRCGRMNRMMMKEESE